MFSRRFDLPTRAERILPRLWMCALIVNIHLVQSRPSASAQQAPQGPGPSCLSLPIPPAVEQLMATQEDIYESIFVDTYEACVDFALPLDNEITGAPCVVSGENAQEETFWVEVALVERVDDWAQVPGLTPEQIAALADVQAAGALVVADIVGPLGSRRIAAATYTMNFDNLGRVSLFVPIYALTYSLPGEEEALFCGTGDPQFDACIEDAYDDYDLCAALAKNDLKTCVASNGLAGALGGGLLRCLIGLRGMAASPVIGLITLVAGCLLGAAAGLLTAISQCIIEFDGDMNACYIQWLYDIEQCCDAWLARQDEGPPP